MKLDISVVNTLKNGEQTAQVSEGVKAKPTSFEPIFPDGFAESPGRHIVGNTDDKLRSPTKEPEDVAIESLRAVRPCGVMHTSG